MKMRQVYSPVTTYRKDVLLTLSTSDVVHLKRVLDTFRDKHEPYADTHETVKFAGELRQFLYHPQ